MKATQTKTLDEMEAFTDVPLKRTSESGVVTWIAVHEVRGVWYPRFNHEGTELQFYELDATPEMTE